jgi:hypothetical protein
MVFEVIRYFMESPVKSSPILAAASISHCAGLPIVVLWNGFTISLYRFFRLTSRQRQQIRHALTIRRILHNVKVCEARKGLACPLRKPSIMRSAGHGVPCRKLPERHRGLRQRRRGLLREEIRLGQKEAFKGSCCFTVTLLLMAASFPMHRTCPGFQA